MFAMVSSTSPLVLDAHHHAFLDKLMAEFSPYKRRYPLDVAALISPIALLEPKKVISRVLAQDHLLKVRLLPV
jgi:hypothetical protein